MTKEQREMRLDLVRGFAKKGVMDDLPIQGLETGDIDDQNLNLLVFSAGLIKFLNHYSKHKPVFDLFRKAITMGMLLDIHRSDRLAVEEEFRENGLEPPQKGRVYSLDVSQQNIFKILYYTYDLSEYENINIAKDGSLFNLDMEFVYNMLKDFLRSNRLKAYIHFLFVTRHNFFIVRQMMFRFAHRYLIDILEKFAFTDEGMDLMTMMIKGVDITDVIEDEDHSREAS